MLKYKGYIGYVQFDDKSEIFHGEVINIQDVITFQGRSVSELKNAFVDSIKDYIEFCKENGTNPEKYFSGKINLQISPELHYRASITAKNRRVTLNTLISEAIKKSISNSI